MVNTGKADATGWVLPVSIADCIIDLVVVSEDRPARRFFYARIFKGWEAE